MRGIDEVVRCEEVELIDALRESSYRFVSGHRHVVSDLCLVHSHNSFEIVYHPSGRGTTLVDGSHTIEFTEGSVVIYAPEVPHDQTMFVKGLDIILSIDLVGQLPDDLPRSWYIPEVLDPFLLQELHLLPDVHPSRTPLQQQILDHRAAAVMLALLHLENLHRLRTSCPTEYYTERAYQYLRQNYRTLKQVDEIAQSLSISPSYLRYLYRQRFGTSIVHSLTDLRMERAQDLLRNPEMTLYTIAIDCGFANERYFSAVFKKNVGCTPGQFRRQLMIASVGGPARDSGARAEPLLDFLT